MYEEEPLKDYYTLMDIAYIYTWRRVSTGGHLSGRLPWGAGRGLGTALTGVSPSPCRTGLSPSSTGCDLLARG